jgi:hypothetical protein
MIASDSKKPAVSFDEFLTSDEFESRLSANGRYTARLAATKAESAAGHLFINGKHFDMGMVRHSQRSVLTVAMDALGPAGTEHPIAVPRRARKFTSDG